MPADATANLAVAKEAVAWVKAMVPFGASNRGSDYVESWKKNRKKIEGPDPGVLDKVLGGMTAFLPLLTGANRAMQIRGEVTGEAATDYLSRFRQIYDITLRTKAGNCNEQSITAFVWLLDRGVKPIAWMYLTNGKHAFVAIGRKAGSGNDPAKWGDSVVVCDPWAGEAYPLPADKGGALLQTKWGCATANAEFGVA
ncbi:MAG: hypothetical protein KBB14_09995 [Thermoanaerobaculia bacterium]|nr:hypothetical protein [Thermoanaerobaculia bacterium]